LVNSTWAKVLPGTGFSSATISSVSLSMICMVSLLLAHHRIGPGVAAVFVAAHEEAGAARLDLLQRFPGLHVDDADQAFLEVGRGHHRALCPAASFHVQVMPEPRCGMPGSFEVGDLLARVEVDHLALTRLGVVARGAHHFVVILGEEEVVEVIVELAAARIEEAGNEAPSLYLKSWIMPAGMSSAFGL
jgi:hypothetical protein